MSNTFQITNWDEQSYLEFEDGVKYSKASIKKQYQGQLPVSYTHLTLPTTSRV